PIGRTQPADQIAAMGDLAGDLLELVRTLGAEAERDVRAARLVGALLRVGDGLIVGPGQQAVHTGDGGRVLILGGGCARSGPGGAEQVVLLAVSRIAGAD